MSNSRLDAYLAEQARLRESPLGNGATVTCAVKLTPRQVHAIEASGEAVSRYIREAVQMRIDSGE